MSIPVTATWCNIGKYFFESVLLCGYNSRKLLSCCFCVGAMLVMTDFQYGVEMLLRTWVPAFHKYVLGKAWRRRRQPYPDSRCRFQAQYCRFCALVCASCVSLFDPVTLLKSWDCALKRPGACQSIFIIFEIDLCICGCNVTGCMRHRFSKR